MSLYEEPAIKQGIYSFTELKLDNSLDTGVLDNNPPLPGFDYQLVSPPNMADIPDWISLDNSFLPMPTEPNNFELPSGTHRDIAAASTQSGSSSNGADHSTHSQDNRATHGQDNNSRGNGNTVSGARRHYDRVSKAKSQRAKELSTEEAELMEKDDSSLSEAELVVKKKAINRLAQRAFRERKESKLKELQAELLRSEIERKKLLEHLEEFKRHFICMKTENQMLRSNRDGVSKSSPVLQLHSPDSQEAFIEEMIRGRDHVVDNRTINKVYPEPKNPGRRVLGVGALWDYLQLKREEEQFENVDMLDLMALLRGKELCHGYGPAYPLDMVEDALNQVAARVNGTD